MAEFTGIESGGSDSGADSGSIPNPVGLELPGMVIGNSTDAGMYAGMAPSENTPEHFVGVEGGDSRSLPSGFSMGGGEPHSGVPPESGRELPLPPPAGSQDTSNPEPAETVR